VLLEATWAVQFSGQKLMLAFLTTVTCASSALETCEKQKCMSLRGPSTTPSARYNMKMPGATVTALEAWAGVAYSKMLQLHTAQPLPVNMKPLDHTLNSPTDISKP